MIFMLGAFTPLTIDGNIIIDGALASCYAFPDHYLACIMMTPMRWFPAALETNYWEKRWIPRICQYGSRFW